MLLVLNNITADDVVNIKFYDEFDDLSKLSQLKMPLKLQYFWDYIAYKSKDNSAVVKGIFNTVGSSFYKIILNCDYRMGWNDNGRSKSSYQQLVVYPVLELQVIETLRFKTSMNYNFYKNITNNIKTENSVVSASLTKRFGSKHSFYISLSLIDILNKNRPQKVDIFDEYIRITENRVRGRVIKLSFTFDL